MSSHLFASDAATESRLEFETLIADTSAALIQVAAANVDAAVEAALEGLRAFFDVDRTALLQVSPDGQAVLVTHAAYRPGIETVPPSFVVAELFPWCYQEAVVCGRPLVISRMTDLPPEACKDRETFGQLGDQSNLTMPIASAGMVSNLVTLGSVRLERQWPKEYLPRVRLLGEMIVNAVLRARAFNDLQAAHERLSRLRERTEEENVYLRKEAGRSAGFIAARSPAMQHALTLASQVAATDATVLLTGETGTGKEVLASFVHEHSPRHQRHMVRVNCSAIPSALIESELFGREKGAYTGALARQIGRFELAHGSTIFLDEIGDLPQEVQVKLLRVLQERTIERLGSPTPIPVDVRFIAATNRDLEAMMRAGTFRTDLYYRLNVFPIAVPPLRNRRDDIVILVETLVEELSVTMRRRFDRVDAESLDALTRYEWPGNVRELRNLLERAMIQCAGPVLRLDVPRSIAAAAPVPAAPAPSSGLRQWEQEHILRVLRDTGWRIRGPRGAAEVLGLKPTTLEKRMARLGIHRPSAVR